MKKTIATIATAALLLFSWSDVRGFYAYGIAGEDSLEMVATELVIPENSIVDEVIWVVGDEPILKSEVEALRLQMEEERIPIKGNPDCSIPEQLAVQKLFLHQAAIDSIEITEGEILQGVDDQIDRWVQMVGSQEKLEEYQRKSIAQIRRDMHDDYKNTMLVQKMRQKLVEDVSVTPSDVRRYFKDMPSDSLPFVPTEVEVEIITHQPRISVEEVNRIKDKLREYTDRVSKGETTFATLARLYSEDPGTARRGGELGYTGRGTLDPAFANVAFNLTDPQKVSKIVESEYGYHIIQLIDKRGDRINVRHILLKPQVSSEETNMAIARLDSLGTAIRDGEISFEDAATRLSDDKDTRNNRGLMSYIDEESRTITSRFNMKDLPTEVARAVDTMKTGEVSHAFTMINSKGKLTTAIVKLLNRVEAHRATITEDYQVLKNIVQASRREHVIREWLADKIKHTYVRMNDRYRDCDFEYEGWVK